MLKVYAKDKALLDLCDASNFTFISDPQSKSDYYAKMEAMAEAEEEIIPDTEDLEDPEGIDSTYIVEVLQVNLKNPQNSYLFTQDLPNPYANNELKSICGSYKSWSRVYWKAIAYKIRVTNNVIGVCNGIKVKIYDWDHGYNFDPNSPSQHNAELTKCGDQITVVNEKVQGPNNTMVYGPFNVCAAPRKEKNRNKLTIEVWETK